ncbi:CusA/CzcA family heavy metal efflux RND transporter [Qipengyuania flava]|jgi:Cu(I)/Ag(I) efflux system membrane protein CusA/SilA|uniref:CusA/CzcA family heavy metal efflux RND transporter n=7 Tax=Sphingomonadales TaxID=204457 RepID=A0A844Z8W7_9SPHN|nr:MULTISPECIES: efflux RND transporter permease subunit [Sphingomonadales]MAG41265.1 CusA/CzcA family heavy metal efflux RND transporter [Erythrobacteraceae bacterium]WBY15476.1 efflux RND transporter permease subunit [Erythrobacteraceae bacterium WH01K]ASP30572.1 CusA/CzcA family heavy metal efflux RND transporter [Qipengyuania flava]MBO9503053.1 efflux RND transporter permease subunit [Qipengyuania flava]MBV7267389.1 efflux RND transporter permease subunit [Erythrobacter ani]|tara:strand:- start:314 stop:3481 length:3168 start_codon:yes stop_codon:yes gene_type:complete
MIARIIDSSIANRFFVVLAAIGLALAGFWAVRTTPVDALPDLSDVQVVIRSNYPGQAPRIVEDQVTYPMATTMLSVPGAKTVRGYSFFGDSYVYVIFEDGTDLYWARSRVLEYLNQVQNRLPDGVQSTLGPDATGVGWIYEYALVDRSGGHDLAGLRSLQDWFLRYELKTIPGIAEVASVGGMVKQYQIVLDPYRMASLGVTHAQVVRAVQAGNQETGGSIVEMGEAEYMVRASGYLGTLADFRSIPLRAEAGGTPVTLDDVANIQIGPELRRGIAELNGEGEVAGGIVILRQGADARSAIAAVEAKLEQLQASLPEGVEIVTTYDRSQLIDASVENLTSKLIEEFIVVALVCLLFLWHARSALVAVVTLPLGVLAAFIVMRFQGVNANIMSLGGIAIAVGAMVDAAVVMIENAHKHLERWAEENPDTVLSVQERWRIVADASKEVGPALFFSLLIITLSFLPVFTLQAQEGRLFAPLAFTKTYAMAAAAILSITLVPVLMGWLVRGKIPAEDSNPVNRVLTRAYRPGLDWVMRRPKTALVIAGLVFLTTLVPFSRLGGEFLPPLDEGDLLYMPSALPGLSPGEASALLQRTDRLIMTVPEVETVFGKAGRADTATDPAPLTMFETTIRFKPRDEWREGMTPDMLVEELDRAVQVPGLANVWVPPIRNRIDMLATGIKSPIGVKVSGEDLGELERVALQIEQAAKNIPGVSSALAERLSGGRYVDVDIDRLEAARYGLNIADVQQIVSGAIGGANVARTVEGLARYPINVRYPREIRDSVDELRNLPVLTPSGQQITLGTVAQVRVTSGPPMLKSEQGRPTSYVYIDVRGRDLSSVVGDLQEVIAAEVDLPPGVSLSYAGQFEYLTRAYERLQIVVPATLAIIFLLLYLIFRRFDEALLIMGTLPFALTGGFWLLYLMGYNQSVATAVGFIALAGVSAEFGVIMLIYLKAALERRGEDPDAEEVSAAIREGALLRVRPKAMTVAVILAGLFPILIGTGAGSEVMSRIAAPMIGGMITAPLLSMFVLPAAYLLLRRPRPERPTQPQGEEECVTQPS